MPETETSSVPWWRRARFLEALATAAFTTYVAWPFLSLTQYVTAFDTISYGGPHSVFTFEQLRSFHIPTWNDGIFNGVPHLANAQTAPFNPIKYPFLPFEVGRAMELITAANIFVLAAGLLFLLSRRLQLRPPAGFIGTAAVVGGGLVMARSAQFEQIAVIAWLPWLLAAIDWAASQDRLRPRAIAAVALPTGLMLVAGHPNQVYVCLPVAVIWSVVRVADHAHKTRLADLTRRVVNVGAGALLGVGLAAAQLFVLALQLGSSANTSGRDMLTTAASDVVLTPNFIPTALLGETWGPFPAFSSGNFEAMGFVGITVCALALLGIGVLVTTRRLRWTGGGLVVAALLGIFLSLGAECHLNDQKNRVCDPGGRVFRFFFENVPGFDQSRVPGRWILITVFAFAIASAFAVDRLVRRQLSVPALAVAGGLAAACLVAMKLTPLEHNEDIGASWVVWIVAGVLTLAAIVVVAALGRRRPIVGAVATVLLAVLVALELGGANRESYARQNLTDTSFTELGGPVSRFLAQRPERNLSVAGTPQTDYAYLSNALRPNANLTFGSRSLEGYDGGLWVTNRWVTAVDPLTPSVFVNDLPLTWQIQEPPNRELLARYGVKYLIIDAKGTAKVYGLPNPDSPQTQADAAQIVAHGYRGPVFADGSGLQVFENPNYLSEGLIYFNTVPVDQDSKTIVKKLGEVTPAEALVPTGSVDLRCPGSCPAQPVQLERPRPGEINASFDVKQKGLFVVAEQGATGWQATLDGNPVSTIPVDSMDQGIVVEPGHHTVSLVYNAPGLRAGLLVSSLSGLLIALFLWEPAWLRLPLRRSALDDPDTRTATTDDGDDGAGDPGDPGNPEGDEDGGVAIGDERPAPVT